MEALNPPHTSKTFLCPMVTQLLIAAKSNVKKDLSKSETAPAVSAHASTFTMSTIQIRKCGVYFLPTFK